MLLTVIIEYAIISLINNIIGESQPRMVKIINLEAFTIRLRYAVISTIALLIGFVNMLPTALMPIVIIVTTFCMLLNKNLRKHAKTYIALMLIVILECLVFMFLFDSGQCGRTNWVLGTVWGISLLNLLQNYDRESKMGKFITIFVIISFLFNSFMLLQNSAWHIAANKVDENMGHNIKYKIEKYEQETGNTVTKFAYIHDYNPSQYAVGVKKMGSLTERAFACNWSIPEAINYYTGRKLKEEYFPYHVYFEKMQQVDYMQYCEEQLFFDKDTMYMIIY